MAFNSTSQGDIQTECAGPPGDSLGVTTRSTIIYYFIVENVGNTPADDIVLYRDVQVNYWYDNFGQVVATQYNHPGALAPGQKFGTLIECPANNTTRFCAWASLEAKVTKNPVDTHPQNDAAFYNESSRPY